MRRLITPTAPLRRFSAFSLLLASAASFALLASISGCGGGGHNPDSRNTSSDSGLAAEYVATDIGTPGGDYRSYSAVATVNDKGQVASNWADLRGRGHGFVYTPGSGFVDVGVLGGAGPNDDVSLAAINNNGQAVGYIGASPGRPILYSDGKVTDLSGALPNYGSIRGINDSGEIVGVGDLTGSPDAAHLVYSAYSYTTRDGTKNISALIPNQTGCGVDAINNSGLTVGFYYTDSDNLLFAYADGEVTPLASLHMAGGSPSAVNARGQITGGLEGLETNPFAPHTFLYSDGVLQDLGDAGRRSAGNGISDDGVVVGYEYIDSDHSTAYAWYAGKKVDLNTITTGLNGYTLTVANGISGNGIILASGTDSEYVNHIFVLRSVTRSRKATTRLANR